MKTGIVLLVILFSTGVFGQDSLSALRKADEDSRKQDKTTDT